MYIYIHVYVCIYIYTYGGANKTLSLAFITIIFQAQASACPPLSCNDCFDIIAKVNKGTKPSCLVFSQEAFGEGLRSGHVIAGRYCATRKADFET